MARQYRPTYTSALQGNTIYLAGRLQNWTLKDFTAFLAEGGAKLTRTLNTKVDLCVLGDSGATAAAETQARAMKANGAGLRILTLDEFIELTLPPQEQLEAWLHGGPAGVQQWNRLARSRDFRKHLFSLTELDLRGADLRGVLFAGAWNEDLALQRWDLRGANLSQASLALKDCNLDGACLDEAAIFKLAGCSCVGVDFSGPGPPYQVKFRSCDFSRGDFHGLNFRRWRAFFAEGSLMTRCRFDHTNLRDIIATDVPFEKCSFAGANLQGAYLCAADLRRADFRGADLRRANFADANLKGARFDGADLGRANFIGAKVTGTGLQNTKGTPLLQAAGKVGDRCKELLALIARKARLESTAIIEHGNRTINLSLKSPSYSDYKLTDSHGGYWSGSHCPSVKTALAQLAHKWSGARLDAGSIRAKGSRSGLTKPELEHLLRRFWCELLGVAK